MRSAFFPCLFGLFCNNIHWAKRRFESYGRLGLPYCVQVQHTRLEISSRSRASPWAEVATGVGSGADVASIRGHSPSLSPHRRSPLFQGFFLSQVFVFSQGFLVPPWFPWFIYSPCPPYTIPCCFTLISWSPILKRIFFLSFFSRIRAFSVGKILSWTFAFGGCCIIWWIASFSIAGRFELLIWILIKEMWDCVQAKSQWTTLLFQIHLSHL